MKYHLAGIKGQVEACKKVPADVKWQMKQMIDDLTMEKDKRKRLRTDIGNSQSFSNDEVEEGNNDNPHSSEMSSQKKKTSTMTSAARKKMISFPPRTVPGSQPSIKSAMASKEREHNAKKVIARWRFDANVPFNGANSYYYQPMIDAIASMGPGFKGP